MSYYYIIVDLNKTINMVVDFCGKTDNLLPFIVTYSSIVFLFNKSTIKCT